MKKYLILLLLSLISLKLSSQNEILIKGKVFDAETSVPIPEVHVFIKGKEKGAITDKDGNYNIRVRSIYDTIVYSHLQYESFEQTYKKSNMSADILLKPKVDILTNVVVKPVINISKGMMFDVTDYFFIGDSILYSGYFYQYKKDKNPWIVLKSLEGDTIFSECVGMEGEFYKDCFENLHYLTANKAFQLVIENDSMWFEHPTNIDEFKETMNKCEMVINGKLLFSEFHTVNQILSYYYVDMETYEAEPFRVIIDEKKLNMMMTETVNIWGKPDLTNPNVRFAIEFVYNPVFAPIIKVKDTLYIINYNDSKIEMYDSNFEEIKDVSISFQNNRFCKDEIIIDEVTGKVYAVFKEKGKTSVREIFLNEGIIGDEISIPDFYWIENIKVRDDKLYFLYKEKFSTKLRALYRMNIN